jgi:hypothetical protein
VTSKEETMQINRAEIEARIASANQRAAATRYGLGNVPHGIVHLSEQPKPITPAPILEIATDTSGIVGVSIMTVKTGAYRATRYVQTAHTDSIHADTLEKGFEWFKKNHAESLNQYNHWVNIRRILNGAIE